MADASHDPFTGARVRNADVQKDAPRLGVPPDKFGMLSLPLLTEDRRQAVMLMIFPPEALRDQPLDVIELAIAAQARGLLKSIALEIYKSYTSDPLDPAGARNVSEALARHAEQLGSTPR